MKLKTKILPIVGICSTLAIAAPIISSCNDKEDIDERVWMSSWKIDDGAWKPTIAPLDPGQSFTDPEDAINALIEGIENDNKLLSEEIVSSFIGRSAIKDFTEFPIYGIDKISANYINVDKDSQTFSFEFETKAFEEVPFGLYGIQYATVNMTATEIKMTAARVKVDFEEGQRDAIAIGPVYKIPEEWLYASEDWNVSLTYKFHLCWEQEYHLEYNKEFIQKCLDDERTEDLEIMTKFFHRLEMLSYYLSECTLS